MKVGILGTSNSILLDGWAPVFEAIMAPTCKVINYSSGANCSAYGLYAIDHFDILSHVDFLVIDFSMNDQNFYEQRKILKFEEIQSYYYHLIKRVSESRVPAAALVFFNKRHLYSDSFEIKDMHIDICNHFGISVIDIHDHIKRVDAYHNRNEIFGGNDHLTSFYSKHIAYTVKEHCLKTLKKGSVRNDLGVNATGSQFYGIRLAQIEGTEGIVKRGTNLISHECINVHEDGITINFNEECEIDSVFFKASKENGYVRFESNGKSVAKNISLTYKKGFYLRTLRPRCRVLKELNIYPFKRKNDIVCQEDQADTNPIDGIFPCELVGLLIKKLKSDPIEYEAGSSCKNFSFDDYKTSLELFCQGKDKGINDIDIHEVLYVISTEPYDLKSQISSIVKAIKACPDNPYYYRQYATLLQKNREFTNAKNALLKSIELDSSVADFYMQLSVLYSQMSRFNLAIQKAQEAIALRDDIPRFHHHLGNLLRKIGDLQSARDAQEKATTLDPAMFEAQMELSYIYTQLGNTEKALLQARNAIELKNDNPDYYHHLGILLRNKGDLDGAKEAQERALQLDPSVPSAHMQLSHIYNQLGNTELAIQKAQDAIAIKDDNPHFYIHLGILLRKNGDLEGAKEAQEKALNLDPSIPGPHIQLSHIYDQLGNTDLAIQKAQDAIALKDDNPHFHRHLDNLLRKKSDDTGVQESQEIVLNLAPSAPSPHIQRKGALKGKKKRRK